VLFPCRLGLGFYYSESKYAALPRTSEYFSYFGWKRLLIYYRYNWVGLSPLWTNLQAILYEFRPCGAVSVSSPSNRMLMALFSFTANYELWLSELRFNTAKFALQSFIFLQLTPILFYLLYCVS
jgi:hypothetical protein